VSKQGMSQSTNNKRKSGGQISKSAEAQLKDVPVAEMMKRLAASADGLSKAEAQKRVEKYGYNELPEKKGSPLLKWLPQSYRQYCATGLTSASFWHC
jgi:magnesium-transporting ATPase (P-type)